MYAFIVSFRYFLKPIQMQIYGIIRNFTKHILYPHDVIFNSFGVTKTSVDDGTNIMLKIK